MQKKKHPHESAYLNISYLGHHYLMYIKKAQTPCWFYQCDFQAKGFNDMRLLELERCEKPLVLPTRWTMINSRMIICHLLKLAIATQTSYNTPASCKPKTTCIWGHNNQIRDTFL